MSDIDRDKLTVEECSERLLRVSIKTPEHLKRWLEDTGRRWLVLNAFDLVEALPWPEGVEALIQLIACYRDHRSTQVEEVESYPPATPGGVPASFCRYKTDKLTVTELDRVIRELIGQITEKDPTWTLEKPRS